MHRTTINLLFASGLIGTIGLVVGCPGGTAEEDTGVTLTLGTEGDGIDTNDTNNDTTTLDTGDGDGDESGCPPEGCLDMEEPTTTTGGGCLPGDDTCNLVDLLFVIDNSGTMGEEQVNLSANFPLLIEKLQGLTNDEGTALNPNVNIMVTTTDMGHPQCTPFQPMGYEPAQGKPQEVACINRIEDFTGLGSDPPSFPEACETGCPVPVEPADPFIHFEGADGQTTNIPGNNITGALSCIGPQGINGCGYEAPLESMLQALNPGAQWNQGAKPFLREGAILAIVIITDEADCSVASPNGYAYFTDMDNNQFWEINPDTGTKTQATSAVCWNAGVDCGMPDMNGVYPDCSSVELGVLHPTDRYLAYLQDELIVSQNKDVIMLGILGVPEVTEHAQDPPFQPIAGGVSDLVYRQWIDGPWPDGDILPDDDGDAATKEFEFGIGPGCTGVIDPDPLNPVFSGQAIPPVRVKEVCESLNEDVGGPNEKIRCCIESVCDTDFSDAINCLAGIIQTVVVPIG